MNGLVAMPECTGVKALINHKYGYRLRVGTYLVPNEVVNLTFDREWTPMQAWREYLGLTQAEVATRAVRRLG